MSAKRKRGNDLGGQGAVSRAARSMRAAMSPRRSRIARFRRPDRRAVEALPAACGISPINSRARLAEDELARFIAALRDGLSELHHCYDELLVDLTGSIAQVFGIDGTRSEVRRRLAERAEAVKDWVADPALKSFALRAADQSLDDLPWLESMVALLTQKPPSGLARRRSREVRSCA